MFDVPTSLSPSRVEAFTSCPMAFRFSSIQKLPEPASVHTAKGTYVHRVLELLLQAPGAERTPARAAELMEVAWPDVAGSVEYQLLSPSAPEEAALRADAARLVRRYFELEDPRTVMAEGLELLLEAPIGPHEGLRLRGIIDRLERRADGELVVTDYKTGKAPPRAYQQQRLGGVHFYAWLCEQHFGRRPAEVRLMYLGSGHTITAYPSEQSIRFLPRRAGAVWRAIEKACMSGDFRPSPGPLCGSCSFQRWCPAFQGDPDRAAVEVRELYGLPTVTS